LSGFETEAVVIGAGVVGLSIGAELAGRGVSVAVIEKNPAPGQETSTRNSGVIHGGLYYPTGSLKARLCVQGRRMLYGFLARRNVPHRRCGKIVVAVNEDETAGLEALHAQGLANGVEGLKMLTGAEAKAREPQVKAVAALLSAETGILSADGLIRALEMELAEKGGTLLVGQEVVGLEERDGGWRVGIRPLRGEAYSFKTGLVINSGGLWADKVAGLAGVENHKLYYGKGEYFWTTKKVAGGLIYPLPDKKLTSLGLHTTVDLAGRIRFGPSIFYVQEIDYDLDESRAEVFWRSVNRYLEGLSPDDLKPDTTGIRPKLAACGEGFRDFDINLDKPGLMNLLGIESPGLTACLALAREVAQRLDLT